MNKLLKIGIGVTTYKRPKKLCEFLIKLFENTYSTSKYEIKLSIAVDSDKNRKGVAARKNENLRDLRDCDFVFLFDDDCYPVKEGWVEFFINSGHGHLLFCNQKIHRKTSDFVDIDFFADCGGPFMFMSRGVIDRVGAFNEEFGLYGFEHADYTQRILDTKNHYPMLRGTEQYIYSEDYSNPKHKSSMPDEERSRLVVNNIELWQSKNRPKYIPL